MATSTLGEVYAHMLDLRTTIQTNGSEWAPCATKQPFIFGSENTTDTSRLLHKAHALFKLFQFIAESVARKECADADARLNMVRLLNQWIYRYEKRKQSPMYVHSPAKNTGGRKRRQPEISTLEIPTPAKNAGGRKSKDPKKRTAKKKKEPKPQKTSQKQSNQAPTKRKSPNPDKQVFGNKKPKRGKGKKQKIDDSPPIQKQKKREVKYDTNDMISMLAEYAKTV